MNNQKKQMLNLNEKNIDQFFYNADVRMRQFKNKVIKDNSKDKKIKTKKKIQFQPSSYDAHNQNNEKLNQNQMMDSSIFKNKKKSKKQQQNQQKTISTSQTGIKLPPIVSKLKQNDLSIVDFKKIIKQKDQNNKSPKKGNQQLQQQQISNKQILSQQQLKRSSSNFNNGNINKGRSNQNHQITFLNIKGLAVSSQKDYNQYSKKSKNSLVMPTTSNSQITKKQNQQHNILSPSSKDLAGKTISTTKQIKQQLKKQIALARLKKKSITKKQKKINNTYYDFIFFINWTNKMQHLLEPIATYKAWVGKGNNSILIKNTLKSRFWWNVIDAPEAPLQQANLFWTQSRNPKVLQFLKKGQQQQHISYQIQRQKTNYSQGDDEKIKRSSSKNNFFLFQIPKQKGVKNKSYYVQNIGLRKLASKKDLQKSKDNYSVQICKQKINQFNPPNTIKLHNHLQFNWNLSNKKALYYNLKTYYEACQKNPFQYIPVTFHVQNQGDKQWNNFLTYYSNRAEALKQKKQEQQLLNQNKQIKYKKKKQKNVWIIKPGENSNRGCGIDVCDTLQGIQQIMKSKAFRANGKPRTHIIQSYIMPFLYCKRKFDIRCYIVISSINDIIKGYWYEEGYIRTSCKEFTLKNLANRMIHLTNDAVQKKSQDYGKYQNANKISFLDFQKYLDNTYPQCQYNFFTQIYPHMIELAADAIRSTFLSLDSNRRQYSFQIFGLDFMIDQNFKVWLIEVNTNPCLELSSPLLARIIPSMIQNAFKIGVDPIFPPPKQWPKKKVVPTEIFQNNKFSLIFDSLQESKSLKSMLSPINLQNLIEIEQQSEIDDEQGEQ